MKLFAKCIEATSRAGFIHAQHRAGGIDRRAGHVRRNGGHVAGIPAVTFDRNTHRMVDEPVAHGRRRHRTGLRRPVQQYPLDQAHQFECMARGERQIRALAPEARSVKRLQVAQIQGIEGDGRKLSQAPGRERPPHVAVDADGGGLAQRPHGALLGEPVREGQAVVLEG